MFERGLTAARKRVQIFVGWPRETTHDAPHEFAQFIAIVQSNWIRLSHRFAQYFELRA